ncbi:MAG: aminotransferase class III-fold pyridoxal phosphate-dependent enzyme [bacterium]|nr:aminotransferase class III-fold pyridoxal phosphate-dependent enzyme [bacterium]
MDKRVCHILYTTKRPEVVFAKGDAMRLWDTNGKEYLDFVGGWAVCALGHSPKVLVDAIQNQAATLINASPAFFNVPMLEFADALCNAIGKDKVFFMSTGAEANESAIKLARKFGQKEKGGAYKIITTLGAFHGRTLATMSATGKPQWEPLFAPKVPGFTHVPLNNIDAMRGAIDAQTCAVMIELIQGEGGVNECTHDYVKALRQLCDENNILLIIDEVQTGIGRTGHLLATELYNVSADIITLGKGIGGGVPLSAMCCNSELDIFEPGDQGGTYTAQPLVMAAGLAVLNAVNTPAFLAHVREMGAYLKQRLQEIGLSNVRGQGLLIAGDIEGRAQDIVQTLFEQGIILNAPNPNSIRFIPPLIVERSHIDAVIDAIRPFV